MTQSYGWNLQRLQHSRNNNNLLTNLLTDWILRVYRYEDELSPMVNGMRHFGISKGIISRAIVRFSTAPEPQPHTVCFHFPGTFLTHKYLLPRSLTTTSIIQNYLSHSQVPITRNWVIDDRRRRRRHLENKILCPWPWLRKGLALASNTLGLGLALASSCIGLDVVDNLLSF